MDKELIDRAWRILPAEFKRVVKAHYVGLNAAYKAYLSKDSLTNEECDRCNAMREKIVLYNMYFGHHNLTSDAEGEEMLVVKAETVRNMYAANERIKADFPDKETGEASDHINHVLRFLFGSKCLPDEACNVASSDVAGSKSKPAEPKFNPGDKVLRKYHDYEDEELPYDIFEGYHGKDKQGYICGIESTRWLIHESDLEPYTEPDTSHETPVCESHSGNTSQKEVNMNSNCNLLKDCDKQFDNILKDCFSKERSFGGMDAEYSEKIQIPAIPAQSSIP